MPNMGPISCAASIRASASPPVISIVSLISGFLAKLINRALQDKPEHASAWSVRSMAKAQGVSKSTVQRWFSLFGVKPHRSETFKLSSDPFFVEKVRDVTGLYLNPPDNAIFTSRPLRLPG